MGKTKPFKEFDKEEFEKLCELQCTLTEIACFFRADETTITRWCERTYGGKFTETFEKLRPKGLISLRRNQFRLAETNVGMAIFLGKNLLGQKDHQDLDVTTNGKDITTVKLIEIVKPDKPKKE